MKVRIMIRIIAVFLIFLLASCADKDAEIDATLLSHDVPFNTELGSSTSTFSFEVKIEEEGNECTAKKIKVPIIIGVCVGSDCFDEQIRYVRHSKLKPGNSVTKTVTANYVGGPARIVNVFVDSDSAEWEESDGCLSLICQAGLFHDQGSCE